MRLDRMDKAALVTGGKGGIAVDLASDGSPHRASDGFVIDGAYTIL